MELEKAVREALLEMHNAIHIETTPKYVYPARNLVQRGIRITYKGILPRIARWAFRSDGKKFMRGLADILKKHVQEEPEIRDCTLTYRTAKEELIVYDVQLQQYYDNNLKR